MTTDNETIEQYLNFVRSIWFLISVPVCVRWLQTRNKIQFRRSRPSVPYETNFAFPFHSFCLFANIHWPLQYIQCCHVLFVCDKVKMWHPATTIESLCAGMFCLTLFRTSSWQLQWTSHTAWKLWLHCNTFSGECHWVAAVLSSQCIWCQLRSIRIIIIIIMT